MFVILAVCYVLYTLIELMNLGKGKGGGFRIAIYLIFAVANGIMVKKKGDRKSAMTYMAATYCITYLLLVMNNGVISMVMVFPALIGFIVDMKWLVEHMMLWSGISEAMLEKEKVIDTEIDILRWDYYRYIQTHPIKEWRAKTSILYGALDNLQPIESIQSFADKFGCRLTVSEQSKHPFMEEADFAIVEKWLEEEIK